MLISFSLPALVPSAHYAAPNWETRPNIKKKKVNEKGSHHHQHHPRTRTQHRKRLRLSGEANNLRPFGHLVVEERGPGPAVLTAVTVAAVPDGRKISPTPPPTPTPSHVPLPLPTTERQLADQQSAAPPLQCRPPSIVGFDLHTRIAVFFAASAFPLFRLFFFS